ncbi:MAG: glycosyltransferase [Romboutsia sp.]|uniref:glycosyltransferase n=1 Tax=Romboutsia sp. TaxID=1965302 RepID=UPI003F30BD93
MKILMLVDDLNVGGTATHVLSISKKLIENNHEILVISRFGQIHNRFEKNNIKVIYLDLNKNIDDISMEIIHIIKTQNIDIIHTHLIRSLEIAYDIHRKYNINYISTIHILYINDKMIDCLKNAKRIICVSNPIKELLVSNIDYDISNKIDVIYNFVEKYEDESDSFKELYLKHNKNKVITYCSRLSSTKGNIAEKIINEVQYILSSDNNTVLLILGDGTKKRNLEFYANNVNALLQRKAVYILGNVDNVYDYFKISDCVIGTARVVLEAINCDTNCIAYGSSGYIGIVKPQKYNLMIESYFGEHKIINSSYSLAEDVIDVIYKNDDNISVNKKWYFHLFDSDKSTLRLIDILNDACDN